MRDGEIIEEREYIDGFTLAGIVLSPNEVKLALAAINTFQHRPGIGH